MNATKIANEALLQGFTPEPGPHLTVTAWADDGSSVITGMKRETVGLAVKQSRAVILFERHGGRKTGLLFVAEGKRGAALLARLERADKKPLTLARAISAGLGALRR